MPAVALARSTLAFVTLAAFAAGCSKEAPPPQRPVPEVTVVTVAPREIPYSMNFVAQTESSQQVNIVARVSGFLDKIAYQEGDLVKEGQLLFQLDPKPFQAQLEAARGELQSQQARFTTSQANLGRVKPLAQENALSQADLDKAQGEFDASKAAVFSAQAKVKEAELNLSYTTIRSPVNGLASRSQQRQGAFVNSMSESANLTYVAAVHPIWVTFSVSQNQTAKWRNEVAAKRLIMPRDNQYEVEIVMSDGTQYAHRGRISFADPSFSQDTGSFMVRAVLPNPDMILRPGMFVTAYVKGPVRPNAVVVPQLAVQQGPNGHLVYVVKQDGTAEIRPVVVGDYFGEKDIVILTGLAAGDRVVVEGVLKVVPGQPVKATEAKQVAPAPSAAPAAAMPAPPTGTSEGSGRQGKRPAAATLLAPPSTGSTAAGGGAARTYGPVRAGETLSGIAERVRPQGVTLDQTIVGIYRANPDAFSPDENWLKRGATLAVPDRAELAAIDARAAAEEVRAAREKWLAARGGAR